MTRNESRVIRQAHGLIANYLAVGDYYHAAEVANRLRGILRAWGSQKCKASVKRLKKV